MYKVYILYTLVLCSIQYVYFIQSTRINMVLVPPYRKPLAVTFVAELTNAFF